MLDDLYDVTSKNNMRTDNQDENIFPEHTDLLYEFDGRWFRWEDYKIEEVADSNGKQCRYVVPSLIEDVQPSLGMYSIKSEPEKYRPVIARTSNKISRGQIDQTERKKVIDYKTLIDLYNYLDDENAILDFYKEYGPLGLLHHNVQTISKYARFRMKDRNPWELLPLRDVFYKMQKGWVYERYICIDPQGPLYHAYKNGKIDSRSPFDIELNNILSRELMTADYYTEQQIYYPDELVPVEVERLELDAKDHEKYSEPHIIGQANPFYTKAILQSISHGLSPYFAIEGDRTTYDYPCPNGAEFTRQYAEDLESFRLTIAIFAQTYEVLSNPDKFSDTEIREAHVFLNAGNDVNIVTTQISKSARQESFDYSSLLGCFVYSMMDGLSDGHGFGRCKAPRKREESLCGRIFVQTTGKQYCSTNCGNRTRQRDLRRKSSATL